MRIDTVGRVQLVASLRARLKEIEEERRAIETVLSYYASELPTHDVAEERTPAQPISWIGDPQEPPLTP